jgi:hypothetical protein
MPFKSEKQRRYLWANEPEIARDWTDTYGSKIKKADGGISQLVKSSDNGKRPGYRGDAAAMAAGKREKEGYGKSSRANPGPRGSAGDNFDRESFQRAQEIGKANQTLKLLEDDKKEELVEVFRHTNINNPLYKAMNYVPYIGTLNRMAGPFGNRGFFLDKVLKAGHYGEVTEDQFYEMSPEEQEKIFKDYLRARGMGTIDAYGKKIDPPIGGEGGQGYMGYPSYAAWLAAQGGGGGTIAPTAATTSTPSAFQQSLNTGATSSVPYYVGADPTAANLAWGQVYGVDPRTMYRTTFADGGPIRQRYFLGKLVKKIGRAAKKVIKSPIGKAALIGGLGYWGLGKMGGIEGLRTMAGGDNWKAGILKNLFMQKDDPTKFSPWKIGIGAATMLPFFMGQGDDKEEDKPFDYDAAKNAYVNEIMNIRRGALAGTLDPNQFVYQGIKDGGRIGYQGGGMEDPLLVEEYKKYVFEMEEMGLQPMSFEQFKQQAIAGMASGGRAGYYEGGQSIPSENTMIDASKTAMQDRLGGITDVMKTADLYRQGDIGQMYMAEGGPTQEAGIMDLGGVEKDYRETGGFVPIGKEEKADDVPARLSLNEFVMTADAVRGMGEGDIDKGAERMEDLMETLEVKGKKNQGAQDMFEVSERLSAVV